MDSAERILAAFSAFKRADFLPPDVKAEAESDYPLPIGYGATNSQPSTVRMMLTWLDVQPGDKVLDVGSGSGWTAALLSYMVGPAGWVYAVDIIPELVNFGRQNCRRAGVLNAKFYRAGVKYGLPRHAPFDRVLVSASANRLPFDLIDQLKTGGKLVIPVKHDVLVVAKQPGAKLGVQTHAGFAFVPLIEPTN